MARVALSYRHYPLSVARFFRAAFERLGHEVLTIGPFEPSIPWQQDTDYSQYWDVPTIELFTAPGAASYPLEQARAEGLEAWKPDALVMIDAGFHLAGGWNKVPIALVATDPHCLFGYGETAKSCNAFFVMQEHYLHRYLEGAGQAGYWPPPEWLPYCYDPQVHYWTPGVEPEYDVAFVGVLYPERQRMIRALQAAGLRVLARQGVLFEEGTALYARAKVALNLSSRLDLPMRWWEGLAYRRLVFTNRVPDLALLEGQGCHPAEPDPVALPLGEHPERGDPMSLSIVETRHGTFFLCDEVTAQLVRIEMRIWHDGPQLPDGIYVIGLPEEVLSAAEVTVSGFDPQEAMLERVRAAHR